jgi:uncharacterized membrane protein
MNTKAAKKRVPKKKNTYKYLGALSGGILGYIGGNFPGAFVGSQVGAKLGSDRDEQLYRQIHGRSF